MLFFSKMWCEKWFFSISSRVFCWDAYVGPGQPVRMCGESETVDAGAEGEVLVEAILRMSTLDERERWGRGGM